MNTIRAVVTSVLVAAAGFALLVITPDRILKLTGHARSTKVFWATVEFTVAIVALLWGLRRLQQRRLV